MRFKSLLLAFLTIVLSGLLSACGGAEAADTPSCNAFESWVGHGKVNIVDFRAQTGGDSSPFMFRLKFNSFDAPTTDGFFGSITRGTMTFSYPRQNNPEVAYVKDAPYPAAYTQGPAFGERISFQAREVACNVFEVHWKEPNKGDTVTHVEDFNRQHVCTNITNINRVTIPGRFNPFDLAQQLNNTTLFPHGSPVASADFPFFALCGTMSQSLESDHVWENTLHKLVYVAP